LAFSSGEQWLDTVNRLAPNPLNRLTPAALAIIVQHPKAFAEMTAWSLFFVSFAPVRTPLVHLLKLQRISRIEDPGSMRLRSMLPLLAASPVATLQSIYKSEFLSSPAMLGLTVFQIISLIILWVGVLARISLASTRSYNSALILVCGATAFVLLLLASGPEATARLRIPALPFLAIVGGIGWAAIANRLASFGRAHN
jgi:hypothetical protein